MLVYSDTDRLCHSHCTQLFIFLKLTLHFRLLQDIVLYIGTHTHKRTLTNS